MAAAAAAAAFLLLAWRAVLPRLIERRLCATLHARGFPEARLQVLSVGLGTIELGKVELWPGAWVPRGRVEFSLMHLLEGRVDHVFLDGAEVAVPLTSIDTTLPGSDIRGDDLTSVLTPGGSMRVEHAHLHLLARGRRLDLVVNGSLTRMKAGAVWSGAGSGRGLDLAFAAGGILETGRRLRASMVVAGSGAGATWALAGARYEAGAAGQPGRWRVTGAASHEPPVSLAAAGGARADGLAGWARAEIRGGVAEHLVAAGRARNVIARGATLREVQIAATAPRVDLAGLGAGGRADDIRTTVQVGRARVDSLGLVVHRLVADCRGSVDLTGGGMQMWLDGRAASAVQTSTSLSLTGAQLHLPLGDRAPRQGGLLTGTLAWRRQRLGRIRTRLRWRASGVDLRGSLATPALRGARVTLAGRIAANGERVRGSMRAHLQDATLRFDRTSHLDRVSASLNLPDLSHPASAGVQRLHFAGGQLGSVPLGPGWIAVKPRRGALVAWAGARVGGGSIRTSPVSLPDPGPGSRRHRHARDLAVTVHAHDLELARLLPLLGSSVRGRGRVDGRVAIRLAPSWPPEVALGEGALAARGPGRLRITSPATLARLVGGHHSNQLGHMVRARVLGALADFDFTHARARLARGPRGGLHLTAELAGRGHRVPQELSLALHVTGLDPLAQARFRTGALSMEWPSVRRPR